MSAYYECDGCGKAKKQDNIVEIRYSVWERGHRGKAKVHKAILCNPCDKILKKEGVGKAVAKLLGAKK